MHFQDFTCNLLILSRLDGFGLHLHCCQRPHGGGGYPTRAVKLNFLSASKTSTAKRTKSAGPDTTAEPSTAQARTPSPAQLPKGDKGRIFLIDAMSFIFRAYHAMARQRPMSTKTGVPTAATYVFVNMLRKLRDDFSPEYLAAVFDVAAPTFRDQQAGAITSVRKFDIKTQTFQEIKYGGYKANRAEMPGDLAQQVPYIRRALEAYRIPILESAGYEADDVIGTLARKAAAQSYPVYVVSSDKDMMQLVDEKICVLNPPKDNLICDAAKVEEILGVPPERVVDVMALRGDSIDNIPGAPGIGDKGSVELIKRFGSVEAALEHAEEVERKTYRESLLNNKEAILVSKQLATIDTSVPVELNLDAMKAGEPDVEALRKLFSELESTSLLQDLLPESLVEETNYPQADTAQDVEAVLKSLPKGAPLAVAVELAVEATEPAEEEEEGVREDQLSLQQSFAEEPAAAATPQNIAISAAPGAAVVACIVGEARAEVAAKAKSVLADASLPKAVHDYKAAIHALEAVAVELTGVRDDSMLYSYLLDPTYSNHALPDVALRG